MSSRPPFRRRIQRPTVFGRGACVSSPAGVTPAAATKVSLIGKLLSMSDADSRFRAAVCISRGIMAKPFAKKFYKSAAWIGTRDAYVSERTRIDGGLCERCGHTSGNPGEELHHIIPLTPQNINDYDICLNPANLQWLCKDCHFIVHREMILERFEQYRQSQKQTLHNGCYFDDEGNLVQMKVYIVHGSPASGKSTLVCSRMSAGDLVVDLDSIKQAISYKPAREAPDSLVSVALGVREYLYRLIEDRAVDCRNVWVIATLPRKKERQELAERLGAELIHCSADYHECIRRAGNDAERRDKTLQRALIDKYFEQYEP